MGQKLVTVNTGGVWVNWTTPSYVSTFNSVWVWGSGGAGGGARKYSSDGGGGGGGGATAHATNVANSSPGSTWAYYVGAGGLGVSGGDGNDGDLSSVKTEGGIYISSAGGGLGGKGGSNGAYGGGATAGTGGYGGGHGAAGIDGSYGGGGGGSGGTDHAGNNATDQNGATAVTGGGPGGNGATSSGHSGSAPASGPGGGGGGALGLVTSGISRSGGSGADGQVQITWSLVAPTINESSSTSSDSVKCALDKKRTVTDTVSVSDSVSRKLEQSRSVAESGASTSDSLSRNRELGRRITEASLSTADTVARELSISVADSVDVSELWSRELGRNFVDSVDVVETLLAVGPTRHYYLYDYVDALDEELNTQESDRPISDTIDVTDSAQWPFEIDDTAGVLDSSIRNLELERAVVEDPSDTEDSTIRNMEMGRVSEDSADVEEALTLNTILCVVNDTADITESLARVCDVNRWVDEVLDVTVYEEAHLVLPGFPNATTHRGFFERLGELNPQEWFQIGLFGSTLSGNYLTIWDDPHTLLRHPGYSGLDYSFEAPASLTPLALGVLPGDKLYIEVVDGPGPNTGKLLTVTGVNATSLIVDDTLVEEAENESTYGFFLMRRVA